MPFNHTHIDASLRHIRAQTDSTPDIALVLGSGLSDYADTLHASASVTTNEIPYYPRPTVPGHRGNLVFARLGAHRLLLFQGRVHFYESNDYSQVLYPVAIAHHLGARILIATNAAGGINPSFSPGDLMLIEEQIDLTLHGITSGETWGRREPIFDCFLKSVATETARKDGISMKRGVYAAVKGPTYETAAEVEMIRRCGGDAVGMSTVKETELAADYGMQVLGISCITNKATGLGSSKLNHTDVTEVGMRVRHSLSRLLTHIIEALPPS